MSKTTWSEAPRAEPAATALDVPQCVMTLLGDVRCRNKATFLVDYCHGPCDFGPAPKDENDE